MATWNKKNALKSAMKIKDQNPTLLAVGHGNLIKQPANVIENAIAKFEKSLI